MQRTRFVFLLTIGSFFGRSAHADCRVVNLSGYVLKLSNETNVPVGNTVSIPPGDMSASATNPRRGTTKLLTLSCADGATIEVNAVGGDPVAKRRLDQRMREADQPSDAIMPMGEAEAPKKQPAKSGYGSSLGAAMTPECDRLTSPQTNPHFLVNTAAWINKKQFLTEVGLALRDTTIANPRNTGFEDDQRALSNRLNRFAALVAYARCVDPALADKWTTEGSSWRERTQAKLDAMAAEEKACEASPSCRGARVLAELCPALARREEVNDDIKDNLKMARKTGAIDLREQHDLGDELRDLDATVANKKAEYRTATGKTFSKSYCATSN